jgi:hypothetical protein
LLLKLAHDRIAAAERLERTLQLEPAFGLLLRDVDAHALDLVLDLLGDRRRDRGQRVERVEARQRILVTRVVDPILHRARILDRLAEQLFGDRAQARAQGVALLGEQRLPHLEREHRAQDHEHRADRGEAGVIREAHAAMSRDQIADAQVDPRAAQDRARSQRGRTREAEVR